MIDNLHEPPSELKIELPVKSEAAPMPPHSPQPKKKRDPSVVQNVDFHTSESTAPKGWMQLIGNMTPMAVLQVLLFVVVMWVIQNSRAQHQDMMGQHKDMLQFIQGETKATRERHEADIHTLVAPITDAVKEMRAGREEYQRENARQNDAIKDLHRTNESILKILERKPG